jgi:D-amino-acid oxidase
MLGNKTLVHNYGHGGSGWSLSWGTAGIAAEKAIASGHKNFAVLGCGIIGLTTARTLQNQGYAVNIYAKELPPLVTSSKATGTWSPAYRLCEPERITPEFRATWERACRHSFTTYQNLLGLGDIVTWIDHYTLNGGNRETAGMTGRLEIKGLVPERVMLSRREHPFRAAQVSSQPTLMFNIPSYLKMLITDFQAFGGKIYIREFKRPEDVDALPEGCVVNCTGLGAREIFGDEELTPIAGQLSFLIPQPEINYRLSTPDGYFIPRKDGIILGGNSLVGSWSTNPDPLQTEKVVAALNEAISHMRKS